MQILFTYADKYDNSEMFLRILEFKYIHLPLYGNAGINEPYLKAKC